MKAMRVLILAPALVFAAACGRDSGPTVDAALDSDLRLAGEAYAPSFDTISALEQLGAQTQLTSTQRATATPVRRTTTRTTTARSSSSGSVARAPQPVVVTKKNTGRDAAIGATAGAVIGATTSRNKVKGGLIGAAIGGIAGAVIGNNVDVKRDTVWR
jgi:uncharacterized protein YcfJ